MPNVSDNWNKALVAAPFGMAMQVSEVQQGDGNSEGLSVNDKLGQAFVEGPGGTTALQVITIGGAQPGTTDWGDIGGTLSDQTDLEAELLALAAETATKETAANKGQANGYPSLDAGVKIPIAQVPTGATASTVAIGDDARLSDARTPLAHKASHQDGGSDELALDASQITTGQLAMAQIASGVPDGTKFVRDDGTLQTPTAAAAWGSITGTLSNQTDVQTALDGKAASTHAASHQNGGADEISVAGLSGLLADGQTPLSHAASHKSGGSDAIKLDELAAPTDVSTLNVSATAHGLCPKYPNNTTTFLRGDGTYATPAGGTGPTIAYKATDQTAIGTAYADVTGVGLAVAASKSYAFEFVLICDADATTTGIDVSCNGPASPTAMCYEQVYWTSATARTERCATAYDNNTGSTGSNGTARKLFRVRGILLNGVNAGTLIARAKRENVGTGPNVRAGSYGLLWLLN